MRVVNKNTTLESTELENILKFLRLDNNQKEISFKQVTQTKSFKLIFIYSI
jgi:hypothetical protein